MTFNWWDVGARERGRCAPSWGKTSTYGEAAALVGRGRLGTGSLRDKPGQAWHRR
ncbi:hypothetical protein [Dictyobacter halimunensis]|uniref:hypothetical protein n=1 Tax=Dictyobacter halimunensis TaxID=3026934 RepID=UPI0030C6AB4E